MERARRRSCWEQRIDCEVIRYSCGFGGYDGDIRTPWRIDDWGVVVCWLLVVGRFGQRQLTPCTQRGRTLTLWVAPPVTFWPCAASLVHRAAKILDVVSYYNVLIRQV